jgi:hypothetical protein
MKDLKYLLLLIAFVIVAHVTKNTSTEKSQAKFLPDQPDVRGQKRIDSSSIEMMNKVPAISVLYN